MDQEIIDIALRSIMISGFATVFASLWSIPLSYLLANKPRLAKTIIPFFEALVGIPTVLVGLLLYMVLSSRGPLGFLGILYTPKAIIIGQAILITPLITSISYRVLRQSSEVFGELALSLGASREQAMIIVLRESMPGIMTSIIMGFSRAIGELGVALMVGGNIKGYTRVLTTAIALEVSRGEFENAILLGLLLVLVMVLISASLRVLKRFSEY